MSKFYGCTITKKGRALIAKLITAKTFEISRIMFGSGSPPEDVRPDELEGLIQPVAEGTTTEPLYDGDTVHMTLEFRSDINPGAGVWINEFAVHVLDPDEGEILLLYGCLGDYPQWVGAHAENKLDVRRVPVSITIGENVNAEINFSAEAFMTAENVSDYCRTAMLPQFLEKSQVQIDAHAAEEQAHPAIHNGMMAIDARVALLELMYSTEVSGNPFAVTFGELDGIVVSGVWNTAQNRIEF